MTWTTILFGTIGVIYPAYFLVTYQKTNLKIKQDNKFRLIDYKQTILIFWALTILILLNFNFSKQPDINLYPDFNLVSIILTILVLAFAFLQYKQSNISSEAVKIVKDKMKDIYHYLPKTKSELKWFILLSISAGICEEIIFRLFMFEFLKDYAGLPISFILTNVIFALTHIGSGKNNLISSLILGLLFSTIYYFSGNIWIVIILHISIDINAGIIGYRTHQLEQKLNPLAD